VSNQKKKPSVPATDADKNESIQIPLAELIETRLDKIRKLTEQNINPYPYRYERTHLIAEALEIFEMLLEEETTIRIAGRIMLKRKMGKSCFADLRDGSAKIQIYLKLDNVGKDAFDLFNSLDLGDIVGCEGTLFVTRMGERTLSVTSFELLTKSLHPLPDKHAGLQDVEMRYRRRYADLIVNPEVRETFLLRTRIVQTCRDLLNEQGFLEVETPILQPLYGGGNAKPFKTRHEKLDRTMYLRIADELYLKRLIIGGFEKVWELCKDFRNEGLDRLHNPEFSMIELYWAYADYRDMAAMFEQMLRELVRRVHGGYRINYGEHEIDFEKPFTWMTMIGSVKEATDVDFMSLSFDEAKAAAKKLGYEDEENRLTNWGKVVQAVWEEKVEPTLIQPTFVADFPVDISPLAKKHRENDRLTERFELFIAAQEMGNAFSELNDPVDQLRRFRQQGKALKEGDAEGHPLDDDFITALCYGMPPTAGLGFGIDRLVMLLTNQHSIRDVLFFPQMKDMKEGSVPVSQILARGVVEDNE
jgi:lysyl-tRNA synthetase class 2